MIEVIKNGRIVADKTFATRFKSFLNGIQANDLASYEELGYMQRVAEALITKQLHTANMDADQEERDYLKRIYPDATYLK